MVALAKSVPPCDSAARVVSMTLARAKGAAAKAEAWLLSPAALALPLREVEVEQERRFREVNRLLLQAHLQARGLGDVGEAIALRREGREEEALGRREVHRRGLVTIFGEVEVERLGYRARRGESVHPLDEELELPERSFSQEVQRRLAKAAVQGPYDEALERLEEATGVRVFKRSAEQVVRDAARDVDAFYEKRKPLPPAESGAVLVGAVDGKGIPMRKPEGAAKVVRRKKGEKANKKRMATVAAVFTRDRCVRTPEEVVESLFAEGPRPPGPRAPVFPQEKRVFASLKQSKEEVIGEMAEEMARRDPGREKAWVCVCDGEEALQRRVNAALPGVVLVLDLLHVLSYLWNAAYVFHGEGSKEAAAWVRKRLLWILKGRSGQVVKGLRQSVTKRGLKGERRKTLLGAARYLHRNRGRMRYHVYLAKGLPIASGAVEGACKNLVKDRMERSGMRWTEDGAEAMLKLRATYLSADFDEYWPFHVRQEQLRLHPPRRWRPLKASA
jgi:hypothetical protein